MTINSKNIREILVTDSTGGILISITDDEIKHHKVVNVELIPEEDDND